MGFLSLPFMSSGGGGSVTIEVAECRTVSLPVNTSDISGTTSGGSVATVQTEWNIESEKRIIRLLTQNRGITTPLENRVIILGAQSRIIAA